MTQSPTKAVNERTGQVLAERVKIAGSAWERTRGLIGTPNLETGEGYYISPCKQIHTFFMRYAIDAVFLGDDGRVVSAIENLKPWRLTAYYGQAAGVLELPSGTVTRTDTLPGDIVRLSPAE